MDKRKSAFFIGLIMLCVSVAYAAGITVDVNDVFRLGASTSSADKKIVFQKNLGSANPALRVGSDGVVSVANDGTTFNQVSDFSNTVRLTTDQTVAGAKNFSDSGTGTTIAKFNASTAAASGSQIGIVTTGAQTLAGSKTFSSAVAITPTTNQLVLGTTNTTTINAIAPSASRIYSFPDAGADANVVMSQGAATIAGVKTFTSAPVFSGGLSVTWATSPTNNWGRSYLQSGIAHAPTASCTGATRYLVTVSFGGGYSNANGTPLTPQVQVDLKNGAGGSIIETRNYNFSADSSYSAPINFVFSYVIAQPSNNAVQAAVSDVEDDGGSHSWSRSHVTVNCVTIQL